MFSGRVRAGYLPWLVGALCLALAVAGQGAARAQGGEGGPARPAPPAPAERRPAGAELTLEEAVRQAEAHDPALSQARLDLEQARLRLEEAKATDLLRPDPVRRVQAEAGVAVAERNLALTRDRLRLRVSEDYFAVLRAENLVEVAREALQLAERQLAVARDRFEVGTAARADVLRAESQVRRTRAELLQLEGQRNLALLKFRQTLGLPPDAPVRPKPVTVEFQPARPDVGADVAFALEHRLEVLRAQTSLEAARKQVEVTSNDYTPAVTRETARVGVRKAEVALREVRDSVVLEVHQLAQTLADTEERLAALQQSVEAAREVLRVSQAMYEAGVATDVEVLDAQTALTRARSEYVNALFDHQLARIRYAHAVARVLAEGEGRS